MAVLRRISELTLLLPLVFGAPLGAQDVPATGDERPAEPPAQAPPKPKTEAEYKRLIQGLESRYYDDRENAKQALIEAGKEAEPFVLAALKSEDFRVRVAATEILGTWKNPSLVGPLVSLLLDEDAEVREAAVEAVSRLGPEAAQALTAARTAHPEIGEVVDRIVSQQLRTAVERELLSLITAQNGYGFYDGQFARLEAIGKPCVPLLLEMYKNPEYAFQVEDTYERKMILRALAGEALADMQDPSLIPEMKKLLDDPAAISEANFPNPDTLEDTSAYVLFKLGDPSYIQKIRARLEVEAGREGLFGEAQRRLVSLHVRVGDYGKAEAMYRKFLNITTQNAISAYNLACILSIQGKKAEALTWLRKAKTFGFDDADWMRLDGDLTSLRGEPEFQNLLQEMDKSGPKGPRRRATPPKPR
ncbi:MAG: HEAT repeat domain-containing protein [Planctomycetes bacterium]|nr:HEAT repeat domain-containing protein [Planctomycetota bacterium]